MPARKFRPRYWLLSKMAVPPHRAAAAGQELRHRILRVAGTVSLGFVPSVVAGVVYVGFAVCLPARERLLDTTSLGGGWLAHSLPGCWLALCFGFNWLSCVLAEPGSTDSELYRRLVSEAIAAGVLPQRLPGGVRTALLHDSWDQTDLQQVVAALDDCGRRAGVGEQFAWELCYKSRRLKPPLSHFCRVKGALVLNYDHFCPWVNNTVGLANYRYFLLTVIHFALGCLYCLLEVTPVAYAGVRDHQRRTEEWRSPSPVGSSSSSSSSATDLNSAGAPYTEGDADPLPAAAGLEPSPEHSGEGAALSTFNLYGLMALAVASGLMALLAGSFGVWHLHKLGDAGTTVNIPRIRDEPVVADASAAAALSKGGASGGAHQQQEQRACECGVGGGEFAVAFENGVDGVRHPKAPPTLASYQHAFLLFRQNRPKVSR